MTIVVLAVLAGMLVVMTAGWAFQRAAANGGWTDVFWTYGTGACCVAAALAPTGGGHEWRRWLVASMMAIWSLRLGTYVALRVARTREDVRYALIRKEWGAPFQLWMFGLLIAQAPITAVMAIAVVLAAHHPDPAFRVADAIGVAILVLSIAGETLADRQMKHFKRDPAHQGQVCRRGLWGWSRHPNYFFEILGWLSYALMGLSTDPWSLLGFLAPLTIFAVIQFGTGIPPLEAAMLKTKGRAYRDYQQQVSPLIPLPPSARQETSSGSS